MLSVWTCSTFPDSWESTITMTRSRGLCVTASRTLPCREVFPCLGIFWAETMAESRSRMKKYCDLVSNRQGINVSLLFNVRTIVQHTALLARYSAFQHDE